MSKHWFPCGADGRSYGHVITKFSRMGRLPHFLSYGAPSTRALRARVELRYHVLLVKGEKSSEHILLSYVTYDFHGARKSWDMLMTKTYLIKRNYCHTL